MKSKSLSWVTVGFLMLCLCIAVVPVSALPPPGTVIEQNAQVFIGEQGLDVTHALNAAQGSPLNGVPAYTGIGWWAPGGYPYATAPTRTVNLNETYSSFTVTAADFVGYTGTWYVVNDLTHYAEGVAFIVTDPALALTIRDNTGTDVSGKSVPLGTRLKFRIATNMYPAVNPTYRSPLDPTTYGYITIKVKDGYGTVISTGGLYNNNVGTPNAGPNLLTNNFVDTPSWDWGASGPYLWYTGALDDESELIYLPDTYLAWAESTLHGMKDNYKNAGADYTGKTVSSSMTVTLVPGMIPAIDIGAAGDQSYYFGENIRFSGNNTASTTYLFISGPNLPGGGAQLNTDPKNSPVQDWVASSFTQAAVSGGTWSFIWPTPETNLDAGTYSVYAVTQPTNNIGTATYGMVSIVLKKPFISGQFQHSHSQNGHGPIGTVFTITGTKTGLQAPVYIVLTNNTPPALMGSLPVNGVKPEDFSKVAVTGDSSRFGQAPVLSDTTYSYQWDTSAIAGGSLVPGTTYGFFVMNHPMTVPFAKASSYPDMYTKLQLGIDGVHADYTVDAVSGPSPLTVTFTDISTGIPDPVTSWTINYGDGVTEGPLVPGTTKTHTYSSAGSYNPVISAGNGVDSDIGTNITIIVTASGPVLPKADAVTYGVNTYLGGTPAGNGEQELQVSDVSVPAGTVVTLASGDTITSPAYPSWLVFIDEDKNANWEHPVKYVFVGDNGQVQVNPATMPPTGIALSHAAGKVPNTDGLTSIVPPFDIDPACPKDATNNYALLISGGINKEQNHARYYNDIAFMYKTLVKEYNYHPTHIRVLMSDGSANGALDRITGYDSNNAPVYGDSPSNLDNDALTTETWNAATRNNVIAALDGWGTLPATANLFIFTTSHGAVSPTNTNTGDPNANDVDLYLWGPGTEGKISDTEFAAHLPANPKILMMMEQCKGGGFIDEFIPASGSGTRVLATAAKGNEVSHSNDFSYYWITGTAGKDSAGNTANADINPYDDRVSMKEAFDYAYIRDPSGPNRANVETPQFKEYTAGTGTNQFLASCAANPAKITVTLPAPSTTWKKGTSYKITWTQTGLPAATKVKVELWKGSGQGVLQYTIPGTWAATAGATGVPWVPTTLPNGPAADYFIKISSIGTVPIVSGQSSPLTIADVATSATSTLTINSLPAATAGATIWINEVSQGAKTTNAVFTDMPPIPYTVSVTKDGYYPSPAVKFTAIAGQPAIKTITLIPVTNPENNVAPYGSIGIISVPEEGFEVFIDGVDMGYGTPVIQEVDPGLHRVRLEMTGYLPDEKEVNVITHEQANLKFDLKPVSSNIPEFPSSIISITMIIGFLGTILFIRSTRNQ